LFVQKKTDGPPGGPSLPFARRYLSVNCSHARRVSFNCSATRWATTKSPCNKIRSDHEHRGDELCHKRFDCWKHREPESHPVWDVCFKKRDRRGGNPLRKLHFLSLLSDHHKQHYAQENAGGD